jgi:hypothetical protein
VNPGGMSLDIELGLLVFLLFAVLLGMYVMFMGDSERHDTVSPSPCHDVPSHAHRACPTRGLTRPCCCREIDRPSG